MESAYAQDQVRLELSKAKSLSSRYYASEAIYDLELEKVFYRKWLVASHVSELEKPGDTIPLDIGNRSIFITKADDGKVRAFYNVCRHRGSKLLNEPRNIAAIQCPYHSWMYSLDGRLISCPDQDKLEDFAKEDYPLYPVKAEVWGGFVFVNLDSNPEPLLSYLGDFVDRFGKYRTEELRWVGVLSYDVDANWKVIIENTNECYHCPTVHPETLKAYYKDHVAYEEKELHGDYSLFLWKKYITATLSKDPTQLESARRLGLDENDSDTLQMPTTFPNCQFAFSPSWAMTLKVWPQGRKKSKVYIDFFTHRWPGCEDAIRNVMKWVDPVQQQDWAICRQQQAGLESGIFDGGRLNRLEGVILQFERLYAKAITSETST